MKFILVICTLLSFSLFAAGSSFVKVKDAELEYEMAGSGNTIVLLEAGGGAAMSDWEPVFQHMTKQATVIRYSRAGNGNSTAIKRHFTSRDYADYASELLIKLNIKTPVILVAHSYGGSIARDFAAAYPTQIKALLMLDPSSEHDVDIMRAAAFRVTEVAVLEGLYQQVVAKRCDYFPRGYYEATSELAQRAATYPELVEYQSMVLHYPFAIYFFVRRDNEMLAQWIEQGLERLIDEGEFLAYMEKHPLNF